MSGTSTFFTQGRTFNTMKTARPVSTIAVTFATTPGSPSGVNTCAESQVAVGEQMREARTLEVSRAGTLGP